ncbi:hypothetical protein [Thermococcus barophilus]|uniref:Uncharacterized protein n=1 Tax=Thermococcus barophilus TaxID=55802 RepID=A0A0S1XAK9_THEBA|nr:hypothetical protein [Thermococcus barophilus]ALM74837.1 conserved membrane hypothetical protein [Thermococcus barophilus]
MSDQNKNKGKSLFGGSFLPNLFYKAAIALLMALIAWYAQEHSITAAQFNQAFASIPLPIIGFVVIMDYLFDTGSLYKKVWGRQKGFAGVLSALAVAGLFFIVVTWLLAGAITLNFTIITPITYVVAGVLTLLLLWPKTGTSEFSLLYWLAVQLVTGFKFLTLLGGVGIG